MYGEQETTLRKCETELRALEKLMKEKIGNADIIKVRLSVKMDPLCMVATLMTLTQSYIQIICLERTLISCFSDLQKSWTHFVHKLSL